MKKHLLTIGLVALVLVLLFSMPLNRQINASASNGFVLQAASSSSAKSQTNGQSIQAASDPTGQMSYQGKLFQNSNPYNGSIDITFKLYTLDTGGTAFWQEVQTVSVTSGYFNVMLGAVTSLKPYVTNFNGQVWLGITPAGASAELTPRQQLGAVGYAMSLIPGASVVDNSAAGGYTYVLDIEGINHNGIYGSSAAANSKGISGVVTGTGSIAVYGQNNNGDHPTNPALETTAAIWGEADGSGTAVRGNKTGTSLGGSAVSGINLSTKGSGVTGISQTYNGVFGQTNRGDANFGFYTNQNSYSANYGLAGAILQVVQNNSSQTLEPGDVAVFSGVSAPLSNGSVIVQVDKANGVNDIAVAGVVYGKIIAAVAEGTLTADGDGLPADGQIVSQGPIAPGEYLLVVVQGPAQVKVSASGGAIQVGDSLSTAAQTGLAGKTNATAAALPGVIFAKALQPLVKGEGMIYVFVTLH